MAMLTDLDRDTLIAWREENEIDLSAFNELLGHLGLRELLPIQEVEVTVVFTVGVEDLEAFNKDNLEVSGAHIEITRSDSWSHGSAYSEYGWDIASINVRS